MDMIPAAMSEGRRQAYLAALGIPMWTVRPQSSLYEHSEPVQFVAYELEGDEFIPEVEISPVAVASVVAPQTKAAPVAAMDEEDEESAFAVSPPVYDDEPPLDAYFDDPEYQQAQAIDNVRKFAEPAKAPTAAPVAKPAASAEQPIHFKFGLYACGLWQLIVPRSQLLSPSEAQLLGNIQRVMQKESVHPILFTWPMVNNYAIPRHKRAAREALQSFFKNQGLSDYGYIVLAEHEDELVELLQQSTSKTVKVHAALSSLLQQPALKKNLWLAFNQ